MAIEIKEYVDFKSPKPKSNGITIKESAAVLAVPQQMISPDSLMVEIEGIHSNVMTINCTMYSEECLKKSLPYWTSPYERAVIMHHNDEDGQIIGRVKGAKMIDSKRSGTPAINFTCNIGDDDGIKGIKNGTLSTVSIGAVGYDVRCSICGTNVAERDCQHDKGSMYDGELCYWIIEEMEPREVSYVILPSDKYAQTMKVYKPTKKDLKESIEVNEDMSVFDELRKTLTESVSENDELELQEKVEIDEEVKEDEKPEEEQAEKKEEKEESKDEEPAAEPEEEPKKEEEGEEEKPAEEEKVEEKEDSEEKDDNKEEEDSNKEDERDAIIAELKSELEEVKKELAAVQEKLKETKKLKESVDLELAHYKVQEKIQVAQKIKDLKESIGIECTEAEEMAKDNSINELNIIYKTLKETCSYTRLPGKIVQESVVDEESDNIAKEKKLQESAKPQDNSDMRDLERLQKKFI